MHRVHRPRCDSCEMSFTLLSRDNEMDGINAPVIVGVQICLGLLLFYLNKY